MILFPGIGYHCDKPILYYGKKIAVMNGYTDCISLSYSYDGKNLRGNTAEMEKAFNKRFVIFMLPTLKNSSMEWNLISMMKFCLSLKV